MPNDRVMGLSIGNFTSDSSCYERMYASNSEISLVIVFLRLREKKMRIFFCVCSLSLDREGNACHNSVLGPFPAVWSRFKNYLNKYR